MKNLKKNILVLFVVILTAIQSNATNITFNEKSLVDKMANNENVSKFLNLRVEVVFNTYYARFSQDNSERVNHFKAEAQRCFTASLEAKKLTMADFPELATLNEAEIGKMFVAVMNSAKHTAKFKAAFKCVGEGFAVFLGCAGIAFIGYETTYFSICMTTAFFGDITQLVLSDGTAVALVETEVWPEGMACARWATGKALAIKSATLNACITAGGASFGTCINNVF